VIPTVIARDGDSALIHGSTGSGWMRQAATGRPACITVTDLSGIIARSSFENSLRYAARRCSARSPGWPRRTCRALDLLTEHLIPGRRTEVRPLRRRELAATMVLSMRSGTGR